MKKSIITIAVAAMFAISFNESDAWVFGKNNKQTSSEFLTAFGAVDAEFEGVYDSAKHLNTAINHPTKAGKQSSNCVKKLIEVLDAFKVKLAPNKLNAAVTAFGIASQSITSDPTIAQNKSVLISTVGSIHQRLSPLYSAATAKGMQNGTVIALGSLLNHLQTFLNMVQNDAVMGATTNYTTPPVYNSVAPAPVAAAPTRGR